MAEGALLLATLWQSAWQRGGGDTHIHATSALSYPSLQELFEPNGIPGHGKQFLPSMYLHEYPY